MPELSESQQLSTKVFCERDLSYRKNSGRLEESPAVAVFQFWRFKSFVVSPRFEILLVNVIRRFVAFVRQFRQRVLI